VGKDGGIRFWCEQCSQVRPFTVIYDQQFEPPNGLDEINGIPLRRRNKYCTQCGFEIVTVEIDQSYFDDLLQLQKKILFLKGSIDEEVAKIEQIREMRDRRTQVRIDAILKKLGVRD